MTTNFISKSQRLPLQKKLLEENNGFLFNIKISPFSPWLKSQIINKDNPIKISLEFYQLLQKNKEQFPTYNSLFNSINFCQQIITFTKECILYNQDLNLLKDSTNQEKELKQLVIMCSKLDHFEKDLKNIEILDDEYIFYPEYLKSTFEYDIKEKLIKNGAVQITDDPYEKLEYRYALNYRQEIEAIAQDIISKKIMAEDVNIILCDNQYIKIIKDVFSYYNIPTTLSTSTIINPYINKFIKVINFAFMKDLESLMELLKEDYLSEALKDYSFPKRFTSSVTEFLNYQPKFQEQEPTKIINAFELKNLKIQEEKFFNFKESIKEELLFYINTIDPIEILDTIFNKLAKQALNNNENYLLLPLQKSINEVYTMIKSLEDLHIFSKLINKNTSNTISDGGVMISDIKSYVLKREYSYIVGFHQKNYPNFKVRTQIFDEAYLQSTSLPSLQKRLEIHNSQIKWIFSSGKHIIATFPLMDYNGKTFQKINELPEPLMFNLSINDQDYRRTFTLDKELSNKLFFKENKLYGSVSSFERYFNCHYAYFLEKGLKIKAVDNNKLQSNKYGTLIHSILENTLKANDDPKVSILDLTEEYFNDLLLLYPNEKDYINMSKNNLIETIEKIINLLQIYQKETKLNNHHFEYNFTKELNDNKIVLRGIIDRVDTSDSQVRVIDYKSSSKSLSIKEILSGIQLQLLTYLSQAVQEFNKDPDGTYYFSINPSNIKKDNIKDLDFLDDPEVRQIDFKKNNKFSGFSFSNEKDEVEHLFSTRKSSYSFEKVQGFLLEAYKFLYENLQDGNIELNPYKKACEFCDYKSICHFKGSGFEYNYISDYRDLKEDEDEV
ncbi:MAG: PD-(D/E)XK nuclease family protein [Anaerorhabdus sp.]